MKAVILAGGFGTRLSEETETKPKPMVEIGGKPILWHIMKIYTTYGVSEFIICCGYKGYVIKEYFKNYFLHNSNITINLKNNDMEIHENNIEPWTVRLINTGNNSMTGGRLKRVKSYVKNEEFFFFTYGDGLADIDIGELLKFHKNHGKKATLVAVRPPGRYGVVNFGLDNVVNSFQEKPGGDGSWINGGFFVLKPSVIDQIKDDNSSWENESLFNLASNKELYAYKHEGFWQCMDTLREKTMLNDLWNKNNAPWKTWK